MRIGYIGLVLVLASLACAQESRPASRPQRASFDTAAKKLKGFATRTTIPSKLMPKDIGVVTYVPPSYGLPQSVNRRYPVMFFLHGLFENADRWVQRGGASMMEAAVLQDGFPECIVVAPDAGMSFYCDSMDLKRPYAKWFIEECLPWTDKTFRTIGTRESRVLVGSSMGGFGALHFGFMRPDLFAAVAVHSAAILPDNIDEWSDRAKRAMGFLANEVADVFGDPMDAAKWKSVNPMQLAEKLARDKAPAIYLDCGADDRYAFDDGCRALGKLLNDRNIPNTCEIRPGNHGWDYLKNAHPHALKWLKGVLSHTATSRPQTTR